MNVNIVYKYTVGEIENRIGRKAKYMVSDEEKELVPFIGRNCVNLLEVSKAFVKNTKGGYKKRPL